MSSEILVNSAIGETRIALIEDKSPVEIRLFRDHEPTLVGAIYYGRVTSLSAPNQAAFIDLGNGISGFLPLKSLPKKPGKKPKDLTTILHEGQKIIVQVTADAISGKSVKLTGRIEVKSSILVLHPFREGAFVSSRIKDPSRRQQLKEFGNSLNLKGMGLTLRTEAALLSDEQIKETAHHMIRHWHQAVENRDKKKVPFLLSQEPDSLMQVMREYGNARHDRIIFDRPATLKSAQDWARKFAPDLLSRLELYQEKTSIFSLFNIEEDLNRLYDKRLELSKGGWITIEQTEAMVVIDVNMGDTQLSQDPEKQRFAVNMNAAREIFRQMRLRNLSGIIVIDFINMSGKSNITNLLAYIDNLIAQDPVQLQRSNLSAFGLLELTRKGSHASLHRLMLSPTRTKAGVETAALDLLRQAERDAGAKPGIALTVHTKPEIKAWIKNHPDLVKQFTSRTGSPLIIDEEHRP